MASDWYQVGGVMGAACRLDFLTRLPKPPIYPMPLLLYANYSSGLINSRLFTRDHYLPESRTLADVTVCPKVTRINWQTSVNWHLWRTEFNYETDLWLFQVQRSSASGPLCCSNYCFHNSVNCNFRNFFDFVSSRILSFASLIIDGSPALWIFIFEFPVFYQLSKFLNF